MTPEQIDAIEARAAKATRGEWTYIGGTEAERVYEDVMIQTRNEVYVANLGGGRVHPDDGVAFDVDVANASFIAHARQDVPLLVAAVRAANARAEAAEALAEKHRALPIGVVISCYEHADNCCAKWCATCQQADATTLALFGDDDGR